MRLHVQTTQAGSPRQRGEGLRVGAVRLLPRGVSKRDYARKNYFDVWLPIVAPSRPLLSLFLKSGTSFAIEQGEKGRKEMHEQLRNEMRQLEDKHEQERRALHDKCKQDMRAMEDRHHSDKEALREKYMGTKK